MQEWSLIYLNQGLAITVYVQVVCLNKFIWFDWFIENFFIIKSNKFYIKFDINLALIYNNVKIILGNFRS